METYGIMKTYGIEMYTFSMMRGYMHHNYFAILQDNQGWSELQ